MCQLKRRKSFSLPIRFQWERVVNVSRVVWRVVRRGSVRHFFIFSFCSTTFLSVSVETQIHFKFVRSLRSAIQVETDHRWILLPTSTASHSIYVILIQRSCEGKEKKPHFLQTRFRILAFYFHSSISLINLKTWDYDSPLKETKVGSSETTEKTGGSSNTKVGFISRSNSSSHKPLLSSSLFYSLSYFAYQDFLQPHTLEQ